LSPEEKKTVAYHEAGHAVAGWFLKHAFPLMKVSIVPRGLGALGYVQNQLKDQNIYTQDMLFDQMCVTLGGRVAESIFFERLSTGARDDLEKVTRLAYAQIGAYGMNPKVGHVSFSSEEESYEKPYSDATQRLIDDEARKMVDYALEATTKLLTEKRDLIEILAKELMEKENLTQDDVLRLIGKRPFPHKSAYEELVEVLDKAPKDQEKKDNNEKKPEVPEPPSVFEPSPSI